MSSVEPRVPERILLLILHHSLYDVSHRSVTISASIPVATDRTRSLEGVWGGGIILSLFFSLSQHIVTRHRHLHNTTESRPGTGKNRRECPLATRSGTCQGSYAIPALFRSSLPISAAGRLPRASIAPISRGPNAFVLLPALSPGSVKWVPSHTPSRLE